MFNFICKLKAFNIRAYELMNVYESSLSWIFEKKSFKASSSYQIMCVLGTMIAVLTCPAHRITFYRHIKFFKKI